MPQMIRSFDEITTGWLEEVLRNRFDVQPGILSSFRVEERVAMGISRMAIVHLEYSRSSELPESLFVKMTKMDSNLNISGVGRHEVEFYTKIAPLMCNPDIPVCYLAQYSDESKIFNIVLEDLSRDYYRSNWPLPMDMRNQEKMIDCLSDIHASWWNHPDLEKIYGKYRTKEEHLKVFGEFNQKIDNFINFMGDRLSAERKKIILNYADHFDSFIEHPIGSRNFTMIHCDTHSGNFLYPNNPGGRVKLVDWDNWGPWLCTRDLAQMIVMELTRDHRVEIGESLLKRYHCNIVRQGVQNYSWDDLIYDFKWMIIDSLTLPVRLWGANLWPGVWYTYLDRIFTAYEDYHCEKMLQGA